MEAFSPLLAQKKEVIAANKIDLATDSAALDRLREELADQEIFAISGASHQGLQPLLERLWQTVQEEKVKKASEKPVDVLVVAADTADPLAPPTT